MGKKYNISQLHMCWTAVCDATHLNHLGKNIFGWAYILNNFMKADFGLR